jgi:hypothetical protein
METVLHMEVPAIQHGYRSAAHFVVAMGEDYIIYRRMIRWMMRTAAGFVACLEFRAGSGMLSSFQATKQEGRGWCNVAFASMLVVQCCMYVHTYIRTTRPDPWANTPCICKANSISTLKVESRRYFSFQDRRWEIQLFK